MTKKTLAGYELAGRLMAEMSEGDLAYPHYGEMVETCSLIARHAKTYHHIQEGRCDGCGAAGDPRIDWQTAAKMEKRFEAYLDKREGQIEARLVHLAASLPPVRGCYHWEVIFSGDPRGATVTLTGPDVKGDNWERDGFMVH